MPVRKLQRLTCRGLHDPGLARRSTRQRAVLVALYLLCCACFAGTAQAEEATFGDYAIHYIAVNSTFLTPAIAAQYGIVRGPRNAFLNIAVLRNDADGGTTPVTATLTGAHHNLMQQSGTIEFREVREGTAIYYIGEFGFSNAELLRFVVDVQPESKGAAHRLEWRTQLYAQ